MLYLIIILSAMFLIAVINIILNPYFYNFQLWFILTAVVISTIAVILVSGFFATLIRHILPKRWFNIDGMKINVSEKEIHFYEKIGVKKWKDYVPELGVFTGFRKNKVSEPKNVKFVERYILEIHYGIYVHLVSVFASFTIIFIYPLKYCLFFGVPVAIVSVILHLMPLFILRYNLPKLKKIRGFLINKKNDAKSVA